MFKEIINTGKVVIIEYYPVTTIATIASGIIGLSLRTASQPTKVAFVITAAIAGIVTSYIDATNYDRKDQEFLDKLYAD